VLKFGETEKYDMQALKHLAMMTHCN